LTKENKKLASYLFSLYNDKHPSMMDVMQNNFTFNLSLTEYANLACKSVPTFKREFKRIFNDTPAKWVMKKRLSKASELLENTSLSVGEITNQCGFEKPDTLQPFVQGKGWYVAVAIPKEPTIYVSALKASLNTGADVKIGSIRNIFDPHRQNQIC
jgi:AraC-like DNA-binding protein